MMYDSSRITFGRIIRQARRISLINGGEPIDILPVVNNGDS